MQWHFIPVLGGQPASNTRTSQMQTVVRHAKKSPLQ